MLNALPRLVLALVVLGNTACVVLAAPTYKVEMADPKEALPRKLVEDGPRFVWVAHEGFKPLSHPPRAAGQVPPVSGAPGLEFMEMCGCAAVWQGKSTYFLLTKGAEDTDSFHHLGWVDANRVVKQASALTGATPIFQKAIIVNTVESTAEAVAKGRLVLDVPMLLGPEKNAKPVPRFNLSNIYFIYADSNPLNEREGYYLLGTKARFDAYAASLDTKETPRDQRVALRAVRCWVPKERVCRWDTREGIEWDALATWPRTEDRGGQRRTTEGKIYYTRDDALKAAKGGQVTPLFQERFQLTTYESILPLKSSIFPQPWAFEGTERISIPFRHDRQRYPLVPTAGTKDDLTLLKRGRLLKVGVAGDFVDAGGKPIASREDIEELRRVIRQFTEVGRTEILFVLDNTSSMDRYLLEAAKTIEKIVESVRKDRSREIYLGLVFYNDTPSGVRFNPDEQPVDVSHARLRKAGTPEADQLIKRIRELAEKKQLIKASGDAREQVFTGLKRGIQEAHFSTYARKIVVLIGDRGDHDRDVDQKESRRTRQAEKEVVRFLLPKDQTPIELYAIQTVDPTTGNADVTAFHKQVETIIELCNDQLKVQFGDKDLQVKDIKGGKYYYLRDPTEITDHILHRYSKLVTLASDLEEQINNLYLGQWDGANVGPRLRQLIEEKCRRNGLRPDLLEKLIESGGAQVFSYGYLWENGPEGVPQTRLRLLTHKDELQDLINLLTALEPEERRRVRGFGKNDRESILKRLVGTVTGDPEEKSFEKVKLKALGMKARSPLLKRCEKDIEFNPRVIQELLEVYHKRRKLEDALNNQVREYHSERIPTALGGMVTVWYERENKESVQRSFFIGGDKSLIWYWLDYQEEWP
jgi:hypothetical protein